MTRRTLQPDDLYRLKMLADPQISPDGRTIAYTVSETLRAEDGARSAIWLVPSAGGTPRRLTAGPRRDHSPRWSPDGSHIAFVSDRLEGKPQVWRIPVDGGEATPVTALPSGVVGAPVWSPDGTRIAVVSRLVANADDAQRAKRPRVVRRLRYQLNGMGYIGDSFWHIFVVPVVPGSVPAEARQITFGDWHHFQPAWSPDGQQLAVVTTRRDDWDLEWVWDIALFRADGENAEPRWLTRGQGVALGPAWSSDGRFIAYYDNRCTETGSTKGYHVWVAPVDGAAAWNVSGALDRGAVVYEPPSSVTPPVWLANDQSLAWLVFDAGDSKIGVADRAGHQPRIAVAGPPTPLSFSVAADGQQIALLGGSPTAPGEVFVGSLAGGPVRPVTDANADVMATLALRAPETFTQKSPEGWDVQSRLWLPPGYVPSSSPLPTLLHFHGGPHSATGTTFSFLYHILVAHGYAVLSVNYRGSAGYGAAFADSILHNWGQNELADSLAALDALIARGIADPNRLGVYGASYGGFMTNYAITHTDRFRAAVTMATISNLATLSLLSDQWESVDFDSGGAPWERPDYYRAHSPLSEVTRITTPLLILHGEADYTCSLAEAEQLFVALRKLRRTVELVRYPGESHGFVNGGRPSTRIDVAQRLLGWFDRYLKGDEPVEG